MIPDTDNREHGFWGTLRREGKDPAPYWKRAYLLLWAHGLNDEEARTLLDSRVGRHMADWWLAYANVEEVTDLSQFVDWWRRPEEGGAP